MATVNISDIQNTKIISDINYISTAEDISKGTSLVSNISLGLLLSAATLAPVVNVSDMAPVSNSIVSTNYASVVTVTDVLPFMLSITNIGIEGYSPTSAPGIGVQVIGFSNYIL